MFAFAVRRLIQALVVMLVIGFIGFALKSTIGDPISEMVGITVSQEERAQLRQQLGLNDHFLVQYWRFIKNAAHGDLGTSYYFKEPTLKVIMNKAPATLELVLVSSLIIVLFSVPAGIYAAIRPKSLLSRLIMAGSIVGVSIPVFLIAIMLIYLFSVHLGWIPSYGRGATVKLFGWWESGLVTKDGLMHLILPSISLSSIMLPLFVRLIRSEMQEALESEYIKYAWAKGLKPARIYLVHAFRNTLLPVITLGGVQLGSMIAFTILTETVFQWQGMGFMFVDAVERGDTSLLVAYLVVVGVIFVAVNTVVDCVYGLVNPLIRVAERA